MARPTRVLLIDPVTASRQTLASRLRTLGYEVATANDGAQGAHDALEQPPHVVIADLAMPSISGPQLCRMLKAESATHQVPVILRGGEGQRNRFWAEQTGASAYVIKGRMGDLIRAMRRSFEQMPDAGDDGFFVALSSEVSVRDRIAQCLDAALFESVIAAEVRKLAVCESFDTLFDLLAQFVSQVTTYRWLSVVTTTPARGGVHARADRVEEAVTQARAVLKLADTVPFTRIEDDDPASDERGPAPLIRPIGFGDAELGGLALAPREGTEEQDAELLEIIARELGGPLRTATLVEESRRLATVDALTGLYNRRAFLEQANREVARAHRYVDALSVLMLDVDHFKQVNDTHGHATGDRVLAAVGQLLADLNRKSDLSARWGGEEYVTLLASTGADAAACAAERIRGAVEALGVANGAGEPLCVTASIGVATLEPGDSIETLVDRADRAMYAAKSSGRNCVRASEPIRPPEGERGRARGEDTGSAAHRGAEARRAD